MIITIGGMQGAGKSHFSVLLVASLKSHGISVAYSAGWRAYMLRPLFALVARLRRRPKKNTGIDRGRYTALHHNRTKPSLARRVLPFVVLIDWCARWAFLRLVKYRRVTVLDSTTWEPLIFFEYNKSISPWLRRAYASFPQGHLAYYMSVTPEVGLERHGPTVIAVPSRYGELELYQFAASYYPGLLHEHPKIVMDGTGDIDAQVAEVSAHVLRQLGHDCNRH